ncbi:DinB family protein [Spirosoma foliorum]|uniref:DinB family protein n=1 Tax=Spirosoma foliorum TaxID=2710596 RepID=A0A7G5H5X0_9BACT|nr:DinB family protein [Spirosoma foliorum]QMW06512.1 DinB family protein [Spirosoma foliorum]
MLPTDTLSSALDRLRAYIYEVPDQLSALSESELTQHAPGKWSRKEILGHLIDSAINNLKRFTDAQFADGPYLIQPYNQNKLVGVNQYQQLPVTHLLTLWASLNTQVLHIVDAIPSDTLTNPVQISGNTVNKSLAWLIEDYILHLEHHLKTLF